MHRILLHVETLDPRLHRPNCDQVTETQHTKCLRLDKTTPIFQRRSQITTLLSSCTFLLILFDNFDLDLDLDLDRKLLCRLLPTHGMLCC